jgi:hypothetical protein
MFVFNYLINLIKTMEDEKPLMEMEQDPEEDAPEQPPKKQCFCCSDSLCIGFAWGIFIVLLLIFIFAVILKYQKDG